MRRAKKEEEGKKGDEEGKKESETGLPSLRWLTNSEDPPLPDASKIMLLELGASYMYYCQLLQNRRGKSSLKSRSPKSRG
jgi:hypothetical protein